MAWRAFFLAFSINFIPQLLRAASVCDSYKLPPAYLELKSKVDEEIRVFSNKKSVALRADETLSKLITAKSPVINSWLAKRNLNTKSEEEIVREWRDYFARNFILTKYPQGDLQIDKNIESLMESINHLFSNKEFQKNGISLWKK